MLGYFPNSAGQTTNESASGLQIDMQDFRASLNLIVNQSQNLTKSYQDEIGKWRANQYDNSTLISVTDHLSQDLKTFSIVFKI